MKCHKQILTNHPISFCPNCPQHSHDSVVPQCRTFMRRTSKPPTSNKSFCTTGHFPVHSQVDEKNDSTPNLQMSGGSAFSNAYINNLQFLVALKIVRIFQDFHKKKKEYNFYLFFWMVTWTYNLGFDNECFSTVLQALVNKKEKL